MSSLDHVSEKELIEDEYLNFNYMFNRYILSGSKYEDDGHDFLLNDYSIEEDDENSSSLLTIPTLTTDKYKMGQQTNDEVEVNFEVNSVATYDDSIITNTQYLPPPRPTPHVFQLNKAKVKQLKALLMSSGKPTCRKNDALLENLKELIGDAKTFTVEYSSELVDSTVVTNEANQIQNDVPPIT